MMKHTLYIVTALFLLASCGGGAGKKAGQDRQERELKIEIPQVPGIITDAQEAAEYMARHYWDNMNFADTAYVGAADVTEQAFANFLSLLFQNSRDVATGSMNGLMDKARADKRVYQYFAELAEKYLYDPNSPFRNELLYIAALENMVSWDGLEEIEKVRPQAQLDMAVKNMVGEPATDFRITLASGAVTSLYNIRADYTLLYFINPDCSACAQLTDELNHSDIVFHLVQTGELKIVAVYPDEDLTAWRNHLGDMPGDWVNGYDAELKARDGKLYDLRAIPTMYLLDRDKRVLLKDATTARHLEMYFTQGM